MLVIVNLYLFAGFEICSCQLNPRQFFVGIVHFIAFLAGNEAECPLFLYLYVPHDKAIIFVFLSEKKIPGFSDAAFYSSFALVLSVGATHRACAEAVLSRLFYVSLKLVLVCSTAFPSCSSHTAALTAGYVSPASMLLVVQKVFITEIYVISSVQYCFFGELFGVCLSVLQCFLAPLVLALYSFCSFF